VATEDLTRTAIRQAAISIFLSSVGDSVAGSHLMK
jgi:hypothetical protein